MSTPRLSVAMVTYNHAALLAQAIESVLAQDFTDWELVIGEDCSTDDTLAVATRYEEAHPDRIRVLRAAENLGGRANYVRTLRACRGEYVAQLDGDDYWTDSSKLSRQVAFLDEHPECALVFHATLEDPEQEGQAAVIHYPPGRKEAYELEDLLQLNFIGSAAVLWRQPDVQGLPDWFWDVPVGDWPMHALCAQRGWIGYIDEVMCVHRVHAAGVWGGLSEVARTLQRIDVRGYLGNHLGGPALAIIDAADLRDHFRLAKTWRKAGRLGRALKELRWCTHNRGEATRPSPTRVALEVLRVVLPPLAWMGLALFAAQGLLASLEPGDDRLGWTVGYTLLMTLALYRALRPFRRRQDP